MKLLLQLLTLVAVALGLVHGQLPAPSDSAAHSGAKPAISASPAPESSSPPAAQPITSTDVDLQLELVGPAAGGDSKLVVRLDGDSRPHAGRANYSFPNLQPGPHTARVTLLDAHNRPVRGGSATVRFKVPSAAQATLSNGSTSSGSLSGGTTGGPDSVSQGLSAAAPALPVPPELRGDAVPATPLFRSPLPIVSLIGFALLIGGTIPALFARKIHGTHSGAHS